VKGPYNVRIETRSIAYGLRYLCTETRFTEYAFTGIFERVSRTP
jgi:hypothetical protein